MGFGSLHGFYGFGLTVSICVKKHFVLIFIFSWPIRQCVWMRETEIWSPLMLRKIYRQADVSMWMRVLIWLQLLQEDFRHLCLTQLVRRLGWSVEFTLYVHSRRAMRRMCLAKKVFLCDYNSTLSREQINQICQDDVSEYPTAGFWWYNLMTKINHWSSHIICHRDLSGVFFPTSYSAPTIHSLPNRHPLQQKHIWSRHTFIRETHACKYRLVERFHMFKRHL